MASSSDMLGSAFFDPPRQWQGLAQAHPVVTKVSSPVHTKVKVFNNHNLNCSPILPSTQSCSPSP